VPDANNPGDNVEGYISASPGGGSIVGNGATSTPSGCVQNTSVPAGPGAAHVKYCVGTTYTVTAADGAIGAGSPADSPM
jgi:hypothetical protein